VVDYSIELKTAMTARRIACTVTTAMTMTAAAPAVRAFALVARSCSDCAIRAPKL